MAGAKTAAVAAWQGLTMRDKKAEQGRTHTYLVFCLLLTSVLCISRSHPMTAAHLS